MMTQSLLTPRASNDNLPIGANFRKIPEIFIETYAKEIFDWAAKLQQAGQYLEIALWNRPDANVLSSDYWPKVTLRCDLKVNTTSNKLLMEVGPDSEQDEEIVAKHSAALPSIMAAQRAAAQASRDKAKGQARWTFDGTVPDYFVLRYQDELRAWAHNFKKIGFRKHVVLREGGLADLSPNPEQGAVLISVELTARVDRLDGDDLRIVVGADEQNEALIRRHCEKMERNGIPAGLVLVEPDRPGIPILPRIVQ